MLTLPDVVRSVRELSADAASITVALEALMKDEADHARRGVLHRLAVAAREFSLHSTHALAGPREATLQGAAHKLNACGDELRQVLADAAPDDGNRAAIENIVGKIGAAKRKIAATT